MNSETLYWWLGLLGSLASLIGLPIAIWQIRKTRRAAEAAKDASLQTQNAISRNLLLSDVSICVKYIEEIKNFIRYEKYEAAQIRVSDSVSELIQIQEMLISSNQPHQIEFEKIISQLSKIIGLSLESRNMQKHARSKCVFALTSCGLPHSKRKS